MNIEGEKIVDFEEYCLKCEHLEKPEEEEPCRSCLRCPINIYSHRPVYFEERKRGK